MHSYPDKYSNTILVCRIYVMLYLEYFILMTISNWKWLCCLCCYCNLYKMVLFAVVFIEYVFLTKNDLVSCICWEDRHQNMSIDPKCHITMQNHAQHFKARQRVQCLNQSVHTVNASVWTSGLSPGLAV